MTWQFLSVLPVWLLAIAGAIVVALILPRDQYLSWLGITLAGAVILTFGIQIATRRPDGFVVRAMASMGGAVVILAVASGVLALLG